MGTRHAAILGSIVAALSAAWAATLEVSKAPGAPYATIQSAIDAAVPNVDEVWVRCGRYPENIVMRSGVPVRGENPLCAFVDGQGLGPVVRMTDLVATKLSGLTIENGLDNVGGGIRILRGTPIIEGNRIRNNRSTATFVYTGGGGIGDLYSHPASILVITRNVITGNEADLTGAMSISVGGYDGRIEGNLIADNGGDYAVWLEGFAGKFVNNTIVRTRRGAGLGMYDNWGTRLGSNVIANNPIGMEGYGAWASTIAGNDVWGNGVNYGGQMTDLTGINGNISADPRFVDENWESFFGFEPRSDSPLVEASWATANAATELSGITAPVDGRCTGAPKRDIGARENEGITRVRFGSKDALQWDPGNHVPNDYNVFRGDLATLKATGVYTQNPASVPGAAKFCDVGPFSLADPALPDAEAGWYYLVAGWGTTQGALGFNSARQPRPYGTTCP